MNTRKKIIFLSSSLANISKAFAEENGIYDVFLILDRKFPFEYDEELDNFYTYIFDKNKIYQKNKEKYFDSLAIYLDDHDPDLIVCDNYTKLLTKSFIDFMKFRNSKLEILNVHNGDLRVLDEFNQRRFKGLSGGIKQIMDEGMLITTIHKIEDEKMDEGEILGFSQETTVEELITNGLLEKKQEVLNLRIKNVVNTYHETTKALPVLSDIIEEILW